MCDATEGASAWNGEAAPRPSFCVTVGKPLTPQATVPDSK